MSECVRWKMQGKLNCLRIDCYVCMFSYLNFNTVNVSPLDLFGTATEKHGTSASGNSISSVNSMVTAMSQATIAIEVSLRLGLNANGVSISSIGMENLPT